MHCQAMANKLKRAGHQEGTDNKIALHVGKNVNAGEFACVFVSCKVMFTVLKTAKRRKE